MPISRDIIYPVFLECCQFATDTFWKTIFEDLAYGKTPYGTYIIKDFLCCNYKDKEFSYKIEHNDTTIIYNDVYSLLAKKLGLLSNREKVKKRLDFHDIEDQLIESRKSWSNIRKKNIKDLLIEGYILEMKIRYSLSITQAKYLMSIIFVAMIFKVITAKDIQYSDGKIQHIDGITFTPGEIILERDIYNTNINFAPQIVIDKNLMSDNWDKYLISVRKVNDQL
jgi:hypothetical protein